MQEVKSPIGRILGLAAIALMLVAFVAAIAARIVLIEPRLNAIRSRLIEPYMELLKKGDYRAAYERFTGIEYRKKTGLDEYLRFHASVASNRGAMTNYEEVKDSSPFSEGPDDRYQITVRYYFVKGEETAVYEIGREGPGYILTGGYVLTANDTLDIKPW